jgi:hypothetical protein
MGDGLKQAKAAASASRKKNEGGLGGGWEAALKESIRTSRTSRKLKVESESLETAYEECLRLLREVQKTAGEGETAGDRNIRLMTEVVVQAAGRQCEYERFSRPCNFPGLPRSVRCLPCAARQAVAEVMKGRYTPRKEKP